MNEKFKNAVLHEDGSLHEFVLRIKGSKFTCKCGCNVFHKPDKTNLNKYKCNACDMEYDTE